MTKLKRIEYEHLAVQVFDEIKKYQCLYCLAYMPQTIRHRVIRKMSKPNWEKTVRKYLMDWYNHQKKRADNALLPFLCVSLC